MTGELIAIALGLVVGLSLGALGGGGSALAVPVLVFVAGLQAQDATTASLLVVGVASAFGAVSHLRNGNVRFGAGIAFGAAGIVGSRIGLLVNRSIDEQVLLLAFSLLITFVAVRMYRSVAARKSVSNASASQEVPIAAVLDAPMPSITPGGMSVDDSDDVAPIGSSQHVAGGASTLVDERVETPARTTLSKSDLVKLAGAATVVGVLTGLFGVGGGFAVVPALTLLLKFPAKQAIGTSLVVIVINAALALGMRAGDIGFDWAVVGPFLVTVTIGVVVGTRISKDIDADRLTKAFAVMLGAVAIYTAASTLIGV